MTGHENSEEHRICEVVMLKCTKESGCTDTGLKVQLERETMY